MKADSVAASTADMVINNGSPHQIMEHQPLLHELCPLGEGGNTVNRYVLWEKLSHASNIIYDRDWKYNVAQNRGSQAQHWSNSAQYNLATLDLNTAHALLCFVVV